MSSEKYPYLQKFSKSISIVPEALVKAFETEAVFHAQVQAETSFAKRLSMYRDVYNTVHPLYGQSSINIYEGRNPKDRIVRLFKKELEGKSILDVGCGAGYFLVSVAKQLRYLRLTGLDISIPPLSTRHPEIQFICKDIIEFYLDEQFDVVFSDQVLEHIAPIDLETHLKSVKRSLKSGGLFIVNLPNRLFGPHDITRIIDFSYTGKTKAQGTHLNELTYSELIPMLKDHGFGCFKTVLPIPKLKYLFSSFRMSPSLLITVEKCGFLMDILHYIKFRGQCIARFDVTVICTLF